MKKIKVTKHKSAINRTKKQKLTLEALGLKKIGHVMNVTQVVKNSMENGRCSDNFVFT